MRTAQQAVMVSVGILFAPSPVGGQVVDASSVGAFTGRERGRFFGTSTLSTDAGPGTFVKNDYADNPYVANWLRVVPGYGLSENVSIQADAKAVWEYTSPDVGSRHWEIDDIDLRLVHSSIFRDSRATASTSRVRSPWCFRSLTRIAGETGFPGSPPRWLSTARSSTA
jgi:hypothetical protein